MRRVSGHTVEFEDWQEYLDAVGHKTTKRTTVTTQTLTDPKHGDYTAPLFLRYVGPK